MTQTASKRFQDSKVELESFIGIGLYTVPDASRLTGISPGRIKRWLSGYEYKSSGRTRFSPALWQPQVPKIDGQMALGFLDLIEIQFVDAFRKRGVPWKLLRLAAERAREIFKNKHPFATQRFLTDGIGIFANIQRETGEKLLLDFSRNQYAIEEVISRSLIDAIEFDGGWARRWWPLGRKRQIVIDPKRAFGQPIVVKRGVPTVVLADAYRVERSLERVSAWFVVDESAVRDAVEYEQNLAA